MKNPSGRHTVASGNSVTAARVRLAQALVGTANEDRRAFRELYSLTSAKLFGICLRVCDDRQEAEDVLHEVYLKVWKCAGAWDPERGTAITWLATIARNRAIDWRRAQAIRRATPIDDVVAGIADPSPGAEAAIIWDQRTRDLHDCLGRLPPRQSQAIRAAFFHGATYAELAAETNVPLGTMKGWVRRGLAKMRPQLDR